MKYLESGFYDEAYPSFKNQIKLAKELGVNYICPRNIDNKNIADYTYEEFKEKIYPQMVENDIHFSSLGSPLGKVDLDDEEGFIHQKKQLHELIKIAELTKTKYIRVFSFYYGKADPDKCFDKVKEKFQQFLDIASSSPIVLLHENEKLIYGDVPSRVLKLYGAFKDQKFALCFDASNYIQCHVEAKKAFDLLKDKTSYYHLKDCTKYLVECPLGLGEGNYKYIFRELKRLDYSGFLTLEPHLFYYSDLKKEIYAKADKDSKEVNFFKAFKYIDEQIGKKPAEMVSRPDCFRLQHQQFKKLIKEVE